MAKNKENVLVKKNYYFVLNILIAIIPIIYELLLPLLGETLKLQYTDDNGILMDTQLGIGVKIAVNLIVIIGIVWYNIASARKGETISKSELDGLIAEKEGQKAINQLLVKMRNSTNKICSSKFDTLFMIIKELEAQNISPVKIISDPQKQIKSIIENMLSCVADLTGLEEGFLRARVAFRIKGESWNWIPGYASTGYFDIPNLIAESNSTFNCITRKDSMRENFIFFNKKSVASQKKKYVYEPVRDYEAETNAEETLTDGSILAKSLFIGDTYRDPYAEMAIFIDTTDENYLVNDEAPTNLRKIKNHFKDKIFKDFEQRLKIELALLYIRSKETT